MLGEIDSKTDRVVRSHIIGLRGQRACKCRIPKHVKTCMLEDIEVGKADNIGMCDASRLRLRQDLEKMGDWAGGRATKLDND